MSERCAICERTDTTLSEHGQNLVCTPCLRRQAVAQERAARLGPYCARCQGYHRVRGS